MATKSKFAKKNKFLQIKIISALVLLFLVVVFALFIGHNKSQQSADANTDLTSTQQTHSYSPQENSCISLCKKTKLNLSAGPCLGTAAPDWVCDVAHVPRTPGDELLSNQCPDFITGRSHHFVEVTVSCDVIRAQ